MDVDGVKVQVLRVFVDEWGEFGNPVGMVVDEEGKIGAAERQAIMKKLGISEAVFVDEVRGGVVSIYNPQEEVAFAGHALVGTAFYLGELLRGPVEVIVCKAGEVVVRNEGELTWIRTGLENLPPWQFIELDGPDEVDDLTFGKQKRFRHTVVWEWANKGSGIVRARTFAPDWGIPEDEANGSGAMLLASQLGRELEIHHGKGSVIYAKPDGEVGGRVVKE